MPRETALPDWFAEGLMLVGNWEPFRRHAGSAAVDEEAIYAREHRPETLRRLCSHLSRNATLFAGGSLLNLIFAKGLPGAFAPRRRPLATTSPARMAESFCDRGARLTLRDSG